MSVSLGRVLSTMLGLGGLLVGVAAVGPADASTNPPSVSELTAVQGPAAGITTGPDGDLWYLGFRGVVRLTPAGLTTTFPVPGYLTAITTGRTGTFGTPTRVPAAAGTTVGWDG